jgi:hypothetical protein
MTGITLHENARMMELARSHGFSVRTDEDDPTLVQMALDLDAPAKPLQAP